MQLQALKTDAVEPGENLLDILERHVLSLKDKSVIAITSKIISLCQGRIVDKKAWPHKQDLIKQEADAFLENTLDPHGILLTLKNNILIPSAGIDESNGKGFYILYPTEIQKTAALIWSSLRQRHGLDHLGVLITDSHTSPLRRGVTGIALGWCGFSPSYSYVGKPDIFGDLLHVTHINVLDALASCAVFVMGEGSEQTPLAIIEDIPRIEFLPRPPTSEEEDLVTLSFEEDIYGPLLKTAPWKGSLPKK